MAPREMVQKGRPSSRAPLSTPPDSPEPPSHSFTLDDAKEFFDLVKAITAMHTLPNGVNPYCHCSQAQLNSPAPQTSSPAVMWEDLRQLLREAIQVKSEPPEVVKPNTQEDAQVESEIVRASKLEFKTVNEVWNAKEYKYKIAKSVTTKENLDELDQYIFVVRVRVDKKSGDPTFHIDIKSESLQEVLTKVLQGVKGLSLAGENPTIERNVLYNYLPELEAHRRTMDSDTSTSNLAHLDLLIEHIKEAYKSITQRLIPLLQNGDITYDLLWALFKPNSEVYATCSGTQKPRCFKYDFGEEKTSSGFEYFHMDGRYLDFIGKIFGETSVAAGITKFRGAKPIITLGVFPLQYHPHKDKIRAELIKCGRKFIFLKGTHHLQYKGRAFRMEKGVPVALSVDSRIMVDPALFRKMDPNYTRPSLNLSQKSLGSPVTMDLWEMLEDSSSSEPAQAKIDTKDVSELSEDDLVLCSVTVLGFSLNNKMWLEFAVADIKDIVWNLSLFDHLAIEAKKKKLIRALTNSHIAHTKSPSFDDFVAGKGRGLIMLFYGPPGVGKTLTGEALSEHLQRPLYIVSAGDLSNEPKVLEKQLSHIFERAEKWKAVLLLDEADVYLSQRSGDRVHNSLISVFLRKIEYYQGIMFLTTNRLADFDEAILSRIHLTLKYHPLSANIRKGIWKDFLGKGATIKGDAIYSPEELDQIAENKFNGREIKNCVRAAHALATEEGLQLSYSHLQLVINSGTEMQSDFRGAGQIENMRSYM